MAGIGHNGGPDLSGTAWRAHCWRTARAALLPTLPIEVVRMRVQRARDLGLDYRTYAGVRAASGRDVVAFLFSSNALRIDAVARIPAAEAQHLTALRGVDRIGMAQGLAPARLALANPGLLDRVDLAPRPHAAFRVLRDDLGRILNGLHRDSVVLISSDAPWERDWLLAGRLAGMIPAERYFPGV